MKKLIAFVAVISIGIIACNTSTIPGECLKAMEDHNIPEEVIELVKDKAGGVTVQSWCGELARSGWKSTVRRFSDYVKS